MDIRERAAAALVRAREAGLPVPATDPPYRQRLRAALTRDIATLLAVPATHVVVRDDPIRTDGDLPAPLIAVHDPDDPDVVLCVLPETGNTGTGGGAYLVLDACPGCGADPRSRPVPVAVIYGLADLGYYQHCLRVRLDPPPAPGEFFDDPAHASDCPLRSARGDHGSRGGADGVSGGRSPITTVGELVTALAAYPPEIAVRLAVAPGYPQAATVGEIACSPDDVDHDGREPDNGGERVVWIGEGAQIGYLPEIARNALGHDWT